MLFNPTCYLELNIVSSVFLMIEEVQTEQLQWWLETRCVDLDLEERRC